MTRKKKDWKLPSECIVCDAEGSYALSSTRAIQEFRGEEFEIDQECWKCSCCREEILSGEQITKAYRNTVAAYREAHNLLTAEQIKTAREIRNISQQRLADKLGVSKASIARWEKGEIVQTRVNDEALRSILMPREDECNAENSNWRKVVVSSIDALVIVLDAPNEGETCSQDADWEIAHNYRNWSQDESGLVLNS